MTARPRYTITSSMIPQQRTSSQSVVNPAENSPTDWMFSPNRDPGYMSAIMGARPQSDNYRVLGEGFQTIKNGMFNPLTGLEPINGHMDYPRNPLDQEQTNRQARDIQLQTQQESQGAPHTQNPARTMFKIPSLYPYTRGISWYALGLPQIAGQ